MRDVTSGNIILFAQMRFLLARYVGGMIKPKLKLISARRDWRPLALSNPPEGPPCGGFYLWGGVCSSDSIFIVVYSLDIVLGHSNYCEWRPAAHYWLCQ